MDMTPGDGQNSATKTLTPAEVHNVAFKKPPIGKRGYDEEEVDNFLDVVEAELSRLIEANEKLKNSSGPGPALDAAQLDHVTDQRLVEENQRLTAALEQAKQDHASAQAQAEFAQSNAGQGHDQLQQALQAAEQRAQAAEQRVQAAEQAAAAAQEQARAASAGQPVAAAPSADQHQQAVKVLAMAQQTADLHLAGAQGEADRLVNDAQAAAAKLHSESTSAADNRVKDAASRAEELARNSEAQAAKVKSDAEQYAAAVNEALETRKGALERRLDELSTFEREYRSRLKSYLESQLRDLEHGGNDDAAPAPQADAHQG
jgi:DivIVA domain-containing protein